MNMCVQQFTLTPIRAHHIVPESFDTHGTLEAGLVEDNLISF